MIGLVTVVRFVHLAALMVLTGVVAFLLLVARPAFRRAGSELAVEADRLDRVVLRLATWSLAVIFASALAWLWLQAAVVSARPIGEALTLDTLGAVLTGTEFGRVWQVRLALAALAAGVLLLRERERDDRDWLALRVEVAMLAGALVATLAWAGHAAATEGSARLVHLAADALHLLAAGIWLGGLVALALLLARAQRSADSAAWAAVAREAVRRFSVLGLVSVGALAATGAVNSWVPGPSGEPCAERGRSNRWSWTEGGD